MCEVRVTVMVRVIFRVRPMARFWLWLHFVKFGLRVRISVRVSVTVCLGL